MMEKFVAALLKFSLAAAIILGICAIGLGICFLRAPETCIRVIVELVGLVLIIGGIYVIGHIIVAAMLNLFEKK